MRKTLCLAVLGFFILGVCASAGFAGEIDILVQKLVDKGVLTPGEAQEIVTETKEEVKKQLVQGKQDSVPSWVQNIKLKGDFRLRYQYDRATNTNTENRARIRARLGVEAKINEQMKAGIGIATGKSKDPRSTNVTLGQSGDNTSADNTNYPASFKNLILDYAYGEYNFNENIKLTGGKFKNPIWQPSDLLWDTDLNPEGLVAQFGYSPMSKIDLGLNTMMFILDEDTSKESKYPMMGMVQPVIKYAPSEKISLKGALAGYFFSGVEKRAKFATQSTNTLVGGSTYRFNYNSLNPSMEISMKEPFGGIVPSVSLFGDYVYNYSKGVDTGRDGFDVGIKFGHEKVENKGQWNSKILYAKLGRDAWLDIFPDSDRFSGKTHMKSWEATLDYGLGKNTWLGLDFYVSQDLNKQNTPSQQTYLVQLDWNLKF